MNLKDRKPLEKRESETRRMPENLTDTMQTSRQPSREQELLSKAQDTIQELTGTVSSLQTELKTEKSRNAEAGRKISTLSSQNSILISKAQEMQSTMAQLKAELSVNLTLNQNLVKENDELRNRKGLLTLKEQEDLHRENKKLKASIDKLQEQVNMSNVEAVVSAQEANAKLEKQYKAFISTANKAHTRELADAERQVREANRKYKELTEEQIDKEAAAFFMHAFILLCCLPCGFAFIEDLWLFISTPFVWMYNGLSIYMEWLGSPYYFTTDGSMEGIMEKVFYPPTMVWILRIMSFLVLILFLILLALVIYYIAEYCIKGWCSLSLRIAYCSLIILTVTPLSQIIPVNLVLVFCIVHVLSLVIIRIIDVRLEYDSHYEKWIYLKTL